MAGQKPKFERSKYFGDSHTRLYKENTKDTNARNPTRTERNGYLF